MKTILILGNARSGTSMISGVLSILGVNIIHDHKKDDQNFRGSFESDLFNQYTSEMQIDRRNNVPASIVFEKYQQRLECFFREHESNLWGIKSAASHWNLDVLLNSLHNPLLIITSRNILHNAQSWQLHMASNYGQNVSIEFAIEKMTRSFSVLVDQVGKTNCPKLWITYEDAKRDAWKEAEKIIEFIGIHKTKKQKGKVQQFISPHHSTLSDSRDYIS